MRLLKTIIITLFVATLYSCFHTDKGVEHSKMRFSRLKVAIDTNANFYLDSIKLSVPYKFKVSNYRDYDSTLDNMVYIFDSVENGNLNLTLSSFLNRTFNKQVTLRSDTTIFIANTELNNFQNEDTKSLPSLSLENGDTIVIGLSSTGCFHSLKENVIISKNNQKYSVLFNTTRTKSYGYDNINFKKDFDSSFAIQIESFSTACVTLLKQQAADVKKGIMRMSTTSAYVYIRKGNQVFQLPDIGPLEWDGYENLIKAINPPWPKVKNDS